MELGKSGSRGTISSLIVVALPLAPGSKVFLDETNLQALRLCDSKRAIFLFLLAVQSSVVGSLPFSVVRLSFFSAPPRTPLLSFCSCTVLLLVVSRTVVGLCFILNKNFTVGASPAVF